MDFSSKKLSEKLPKPGKNFLKQIDNVTWRLMFVLSMIMVFSRLSGNTSMKIINEIYILPDTFINRNLTFIILLG